MVKTENVSSLKVRFSRPTWSTILVYRLGLYQIKLWESKQHGFFWSMPSFEELIFITAIALSGLKIIYIWI